MLFSLYSFILILFLFFLFSVDARTYLQSWTEPLDQLKIFAWATLTKTPRWEDVKSVMLKLEELNLYNAKENACKLHTQFGFVESYCPEDKIKIWRDDKMPIANRWVEVFGHLHNKNCEYTEIAKIIEYIFCLPGTTASVERVFASVNKSWTSEKTRLDLDTLKAIISVKCNLTYTCIEFYHFLKSKPELLRQIAKKEKYGTQKANLDNDSDDDNDDNDVIFNEYINMSI